MADPLRTVSPPGKFVLLQFYRPSRWNSCRETPATFALTFRLRNCTDYADFEGDALHTASSILHGSFLVPKIAKITQTITKSPVLWGVLGTSAFYCLIHAGPLNTPIVKRYFTTHPVEYIETVMFAIGLAALLLRLSEVVGQLAGLGQSPLGPGARPGQSLESHCQELIQRLEVARPPQNGYYIGRLRAAIHYVWRRGGADGLDDELKYLADVDIGRSQAAYSLFRVIVWAVPIMGFLGTVIGITMALNGIDKTHLDESMQAVLAGLGLKFDTTALALAMAMVLMFVHFFVDRAEAVLLERVDRRVEEELSGRFPQLSNGADGQVAAVRRMAETLVQMTERLVQRQAELWQASMEAAAGRWARLTDGAAETVKKGLVESLKDHAKQLAAAEQAGGEQNRRHWAQVQQAQMQQVQAIGAVQTALVRQAEILQRAVEASGEVTRLEDALNRNLATLAGAKHFEQTVMELSAVIHLLNARLSETPVGAGKPSIQLEPGRRAAHAA